MANLTDQVSLFHSANTEQQPAAQTLLLISLRYHAAT